MSEGAVYEQPKKRGRPSKAGAIPEFQETSCMKDPTGMGTGAFYQGNRLKAAGYEKVREEDGREIWRRPWSMNTAAAKAREEKTNINLYGDPKDRANAKSRWNQVQRMKAERIELSEGGAGAEFFEEEGPPAEPGG